MNDGLWRRCSAQPSFRWLTGPDHALIAKVPDRDHQDIVWSRAHRHQPFLRSSHMVGQAESTGDEPATHHVEPSQDNGCATCPKDATEAWAKSSDDRRVADLGHHAGDHVVEIVAVKRP